MEAYDVTNIQKGFRIKMEVSFAHELNQITSMYLGINLIKCLFWTITISSRLV